MSLGFPCGSDGKASACNAGDLGSIPGLGRSSGESNGNPLQYCCLKNRGMDRGTPGTQSWTPLSDFTSLHKKRERRQKEEERRGEEKRKGGKGNAKKIGGEKEKGGKKKESKEGKLGTM